MLPRDGVYDPEDLLLLGEVMDRVTNSLPSEMRTQRNREAAAKRILACAAGGERNPEALARAGSPGRGAAAA